MECPKCGFILDAFTVDCPRCRRMAQTAPVQDSAPEATPAPVLVAFAPAQATPATGKYWAWGVVIVLMFFIIRGCASCLGPGTPPEELAKIQVTHEIQDLVNETGKFKVVVWIANTADKTFNGTVWVRSKGVDGATLDSDALMPEDLSPGKRTYGIVWLTISHLAPSIETEVTSGTFE